jgi:hypothetical protein
MSKRKPGTRASKLRPVTEAEIDEAIAAYLPPAPSPAASQLHELFNQQVRQTLDASDLSEDEKQSILVAMACPCCGGGSGMLTYKLKK